jgi:hypothetical protein
MISFFDRDKDMWRGKTVNNVVTVKHPSRDEYIAVPSMSSVVMDPSPELCLEFEQGYAMEIDRVHEFEKKSVITTTSIGEKSSTAATPENPTVEEAVALIDEGFQNIMNIPMADPIMRAHRDQIAEDYEKMDKTDMEAVTSMGYANLNLISQLSESLGGVSIR